VRAFEDFISATDNIDAAQQRLSAETHLSVSTIHWYSKQLRNLFELPSRTPLALIASHPQLRQALESLFVRKVRSDRLSLTSAKDLSVIIPTNGEMLSIEELLKSLYPREGVNAASCYRALKARCLKKQVLKSDGTPCAIEDLPSQSSITRFLRQWRKESVAVRRGRSRKEDWQREQEQFVTRDVTQYRPGELWIGDHTELDFMVVNENNKPDRRWITAFIDIRTGLIMGYNLNWQPNSTTIALAFRAGVLGTQIKACVESTEGMKYQSVQINSVPETVMLDNGKDYRSNYTKRVFGKIDFDDKARMSVERITHLHYTMKYHGQSKAQMERWFRTIQFMTKYLPGFKGNQYRNKPDSLKEEMKQQSLLHVEQFDAMIAIAINAYNNRIHRTLKNQSPLQCYLTNETVQRTIDPHVLDFLMLKKSDKVISRCQIKMFGQEYYSDALSPFNDKHGDVYYDPSDLGFVTIYADGRFAAVASNKAMIGRDENGWKRILRERSRNEKDLQTELKDYRRGVSSLDAKMMLLEGELLDVSPVNAEMLSKRSPTMTVLTGLEAEAKKQQRALEVEKSASEKEEKRKKLGGTSLSLAAVNDRIR
jgi:transposase InsO family protein